MGHDTAFDTLPDYFRFFAGEARATGSALYACLAEGMAEDSFFHALADARRPGQPPANMILAAVHFLLLGGADHPLAKHYPSCSGDQPPPPDDPFPLFADFARTHETTIRGLMGRRVTNTNEVRRATVLRPALDLMAQRAQAPVHLVELGPSAGLLLVMDHYTVRYTRDGRSVTPQPSPYATDWVLDCELKGEITPPLSAHAPIVASRTGLELNPVDLEDPEARLWLRALIWPERLDRIANLDRALAVRETLPVEILEGDAVGLLEPTLLALPATEPACVFHSHFAYQLPRPVREALDQTCTMIGVDRPFWRIGFEWDGNAYPLTLSHYGREGMTTETLGDAHPHGAWLSWRP